MKLHLLLSGRCNLDCAYCFQNDRRVGRRMSFTTAQASLDAVLGAGEAPHEVVLSGGEPFLAAAVVRRVVGAIRERPEPAGPVECSALTNGTLITDDDLDFLARHDVALQVSFDGVPAAQARRAPRTHDKVLSLLERTLARQPAWARRRLSVAMIVQAATVSTLARSVRGLLSLGVGKIILGPLMTHDPGWRRATLRQLEGQVEEIVTASRRLRAHTGTVPVSFLQSNRGASAPVTRVPGAFCSVSSSESVTVDPDGHAWGCPSFTGSVQRLPPLGRAAAERLDLGDVVESGFRNRLARLPRRAGLLPLLRDRHKKWTWRGRCRDCSLFQQCLVCPVTTAHAPGNRDPHRIPAHQCDFQFVTLAARRDFLGQAGGLDWLLTYRHSPSFPFVSPRS